MSAERPVVAVGAVCQQGDELLMVRTGHGAAGGTWSVPTCEVAPGELLAEAVVRAVSDQAGLAGLCGPFIGWSEDLVDDAHVVTMYFDCVLLEGVPDDSDDDVEVDLRHDGPDAARTAVERRSVPTWDVCELRLADGVAEFLADHGIIDTVV